ncbi:MAG: TldD/PmbA family protein [Methanobacteriota archaeon]|nr:MAG: TldD/PmbA family protein [Euryarchaeota archaeon]
MNWKAIKSKCPIHNTISLIDILAKIGEGSKAQYTELRYQSRHINRISIEKGELESASSISNKGVGIRTLVNGAWGFSSTNRLDREGLVACLENSFKAGKVASQGRRDGVEALAEAELAQGSFKPKINDPVENHSLEEKMELVREIEKRTRSYSNDIKSSTCTYYEIMDEKSIVTSDGANVELMDVKPEFSVSAVAGRNGDMNRGYEAVCVTGGWKDLFSRKSPEQVAEKAAKLALELLDASNPEGGTSQVILHPSLVGLICHEAIGHTVEGDLVSAGSITKDKIGQMVASPLVTLVDSGMPEMYEHSAGSIPVDDEGVKCKDSRIIVGGELRTYLVGREIAGSLGVDPCGNARAYEYGDTPVIRMRNTYIEPGESKVEEIIQETKKGYLLKGGGEGQADANAEFMFTVEEAYEVRNGEIGKLLKNVTISGRAFDVLKSVDMVGQDFEFDMGYGFCFKGQAAKVDGGGPHLRCKALVGGRTEG